MRSPEELKQLLLACYDVDNLEYARSQFQSQLTSEELVFLRERHESRLAAYANVQKELDLELITEGEALKRVEALDKKYATEVI